MAPTNLQATRTGENTVALTWGSSLFATTYDVERGTALNANGTLGGTITDITPGGTTNTSVTDSNAFQQTTFYYQVTASNGGGTSPASNTATVTATFSLVPQNAISANFTGGGNGGSGAVSISPDFDHGKRRARQRTGNNVNLAAAERSIARNDEQRRRNRVDADLYRRWDL